MCYSLILNNFFALSYKTFLSIAFEGDNFWMALMILAPKQELPVPILSEPR